MQVLCLFTLLSRLVVCSSVDSPLEIRMINDQLMQLERAFIDSEGLPLRQLHKYVTVLIYNSTC